MPANITNGDLRKYIRTAYSSYASAFGYTNHTEWKDFPSLTREQRSKIITYMRWFLLQQEAGNADFASNFLTAISTDIPLTEIYQSPGVYSKQLNDIFSEDIQKLELDNEGVSRDEYSKAVSKWGKVGGKFFIGPHPISLPGPEAIRITERYGLDSISTLRTNSDPIWRTNKSLMSIEVTAIYPDTRSINEKLRPIIALLRGSPFTTLTGALLRKVLIRDLGQDNLFRLWAAAAQDWETNLAKVKDVAQRYGFENVGQVKAALSADQPLGQAIQKLAKEQNLPTVYTKPAPISNPNVPVMCLGVRLDNIDEAPEALRASFTFALINDLCVSRNGVKYRDIDGNPTTDPSECVWLKKYIEFTYLTEGKHTYLKPVEYSFDPSFKLEYSLFGTDNETETIETDDKHIKLINISCGYDNKVAAIPLLGEAIPGAQYLGSNNINAQLVFQCTEKGVEEIHRAKDHIEAFIRSELKSDRQESVLIENPILNLLGAHEFVVTNISTQTPSEATEYYRVVVSLIEAGIDIRSRESLVLNISPINKDLALSLWMHFWDVLKAGIDPQNDKYTKESPEFKAIVRVLFGNPNIKKDNGILTGEFAALWIHFYSNFREIHQDWINLIGGPVLGITDLIREDLPWASEADLQTVLYGSKNGSGKFFKEGWQDAILSGKSFNESWQDAILNRTILAKGILWDSYAWRAAFDIMWNKPHIGSLSVIQKPTTLPAPYRGPESGRKGPYRHEMLNRTANLPGSRNSGDLIPNAATRSFRRFYFTITTNYNSFPTWKDRAKQITANNKAGISGIETSWPDITKHQKEARRLESYPDMNLPTYRELFWIEELKKIHPSWVRFAPSNDSLGKSSQLNGETDNLLESISAHLDDIVDPVFYFYAENYKKFLNGIKEDTIGELVIAQALSDNTIKIAFDPIIETPNVERLSELFEKASVKNSQSKNKDQPESKRANELRRKLNDGEIKEITLMSDTRNVVVGRVIAKDKGFKYIPVIGSGRIVTDMNGDLNFDTKDGKRIREIIEGSIDRLKCDKFDARRMYPAFRLRLIDFETGYFTDDFYDYNAVRRISITHDKYDASLAQIEISNVSGHLDVDRFLTKDEISKAGIPSDDEYTNKDDMTRGKYFRYIKLREGTAIQVLMGYSSNPDNLDVVFTGRISQIQPGEIVTIIAQDYKTELLNEISFVHTGTHRELVRHVFNKIDGQKDQGGEDKEDEEKNATPHLGTKYSILSDEDKNDIEGLFKANFGDTGTVSKEAGPKIGNRTFADLLTEKPDRMKNINFFGEDKIELREWLALYQPAFDTLQEIARFQPGWVCQVRPYDHIGTLYIGPVDGDYYYTGKHNRAILDILSKGTSSKVKETVNNFVKAFREFQDYYYIDKKYAEPRRDLPEDLKESDLIPQLSQLQQTYPQFYRIAVGIFWGMDLTGTLGEPSPAFVKEIFDITSDILSNLDEDKIQANYSTGTLSSTRVADVVVTFRRRGLLLPKDPLFRGEESKYGAERGFTTTKEMQDLIDELCFGAVGFFNRRERGELLEERVANKTFLEMAIGYRKVLRVFLYYFLKWINETDDQSKLRVLGKELSAAETILESPDRKSFRQIHHVTSRFDIIENNIVASMKEMANTVLIRYPKGGREFTNINKGSVGTIGGQDIFVLNGEDTEWADFPTPNGLSYHPNLSWEEKKLNIAIEKNAITSSSGKEGKDWVAFTFENRMAESLQPMYRGNILVWGRSIWPYDWIFITDSYNEIRGPIEAERVIHHFEPGTGWVTKIIPHAVVHVDNNVSIFMESALVKFLNTLDTILEVGGWVWLGLSIISLGTGLTLAGLAAAGRTAVVAMAKRAGAEFLAKEAARKLAPKLITEGLSKMAARKAIQEMAVSEAAWIWGTKIASTPLIMDVGKVVGTNFMANFPSALSLFSISTLLFPLADAAGEISNTIAISDWEKIEGFVSLSPLLYQGRPLVAGLKLDDGYYITRVGSVWKQLVDVISISKFTDNEETALPEQIFQIAPGD